MVRVHLNEFECGSRIMTKGIPSYTRLKVKSCFKKSQKMAETYPPVPKTVFSLSVFERVSTERYKFEVMRGDAR